MTSKTEGYHKTIEVWGDLTITFTDWDRETGDPIFGVLVTTHCPDEDDTVGGTFKAPSAMYLSQEEIPKVIKALKEFLE